MKSSRLEINDDARYYTEIKMIASAYKAVVKHYVIEV